MDMEQVATEFRDKYAWYDSTESVLRMLDDLGGILRQHDDPRTADVLESLAVKLHELPRRSK